jgi:L-fuconolactonase
MMICDAQVHIWARETPERPWPIDGPKRAHRPIPLEADELLREMDAAGVDGGFQFEAQRYQANLI